MALQLSSTVRYAAILTLTFFTVSVVYNVANTPNIDLSLPNMGWTMRNEYSSDAKDMIRRNADIVKGGVAMPFDMFEESIALMGRVEHRERLEHITWGTSTSPLLGRAEHRERLEHLIGAASPLPAWRIPLKDGGDCHHTVNRDYAEHPIIMATRESDKLKECNVPSATPNGYGKDVPIDVVGPGGFSGQSRVSKSSCTRHVQFSMENSKFSSDKRDTFDGTPQLTSSIPIQYMDWHQFRFWEFVKTKKKTAAAFISNCSFKKRNDIVQDLQKYGVDVQSYGGCMNNAKEPGGRQKGKLLRSYRFSLAFENSETPDYITEKFFDALESGAVPVYLGAPNVRLFAPSDHSFIDVNDFANTEALAKHLLYLEGNDTAYREYLQWKVDGYSEDFQAWLHYTCQIGHLHPSKFTFIRQMGNDTAYREYLQWKVDGYSEDFQALMDISCYHSLCRSCVLAADMLRLDFGSSVYDAPLAVHAQPKLKLPTSIYDSGATPKPLMVRLRERGTYRFVDVTLYDRTFAHLVDAALRYLEEHHKERWGNDREAFTFTWDKLEDDDDVPWPPKERRKSVVLRDHRKKVYGLSTVGFRRALLRDSDVEELDDGAEIEVIFV